MAKSPYFKGISLFLVEFLKIFPLNHIKFSNISSMKIVITFGLRATLLKMSVENGQFRAFSPMKFQTVDRYEKAISLLYLDIICHRLV